MAVGSQIEEKDGRAVARLPNMEKGLGLYFYLE